MMIKDYYSGGIYDRVILMDDIQVRAFRYRILCRVAI